MTNGARWDPEMRAAVAALDAAAAHYPPLRDDLSLGAQREAHDGAALAAGQGGAAMAEVSDRWIHARGRAIRARLYRPTAAPLAPGVVFFHGGGWVWCTIETHDRLARELAAASGAAVVSVDYALSPEAKFPAALEECHAVSAHLAAEGAAWGIDGRRLAVAGDSAGGNLAIATALLARARGGPLLSALLAIYPVCAPEFTTPSYREFGAEYGLTAARMEKFWDEYLRDGSDRFNPLADVLRADLSGLPPALVQLAELDVLRSEGETLAARLRASGVACALETYPGVVHGFLRYTAEVARAREAAARAGAWLAARLGG